MITSVCNNEHKLDVNVICTHHCYKEHLMFNNIQMINKSYLYLNSNGCWTLTNEINLTITRSVGTWPKHSK